MQPFFVFFQAGAFILGERVPYGGSILQLRADKRVICCFSYLLFIFVLMCKNCPQIMIFLREFFTAGRQGKCFLFSSLISICRNRTCKIFGNRS